MTSRPLDRVLGEHALFHGLDPIYLELLAGCARTELFKPGQFIFRHGQSADRFYLIRRGKVALEASAVERGVITIQTLGKGDVLGYSWLLPPYHFQHDAHALRWTAVLSLDASCLRGKCDADHDLGYQLLQRFLPLFADRLHHVELQLMDVYHGRR